MAHQLTDPETRSLTFNDGACRDLTVERAVWDALDRIAEREGLPWTALTTELFRRSGGQEIRSALRVMTLQYFRHLTSNPNDIDSLHFSLSSVN